MTPCACGCGTAIQNPDARGRPRLFARGHNLRGDDHWVRQGLRKTWTSGNGRKARSAWVGRKHSEETKAKISAARSRPSPWLSGSANGMSGRTGAANPNYRGGTTPERQLLYASTQWREVARAVKRRDGGCVDCGASAELHVHHIRSFAEHPDLRLDPANLVTLCRRHHIDRHRKEVTP